MFKIGEFSQLCQVSVRMLRHYEKLGLLLPAHTDEFSGYRYYCAEQLPQVQSILTLRGLGFSLAQTTRLAGGDLSSEQVLGMLKLKQAELRQERDENAARLARVEAHLEQFQRTRILPTSEAFLKRVDPIRAASIRAVVPTYQQGGLLLQQLREFLGSFGLSQDCGYLCIYHDPEKRLSDIDTEAAYPLPPSFVPPSELPPGIRIGELPALEAAACILHQGDVNLIGYSYGAVGSWIATNGYRIVGPSRVVFLRSGETAEEDLREVQWPVLKD